MLGKKQMKEKGCILVKKILAVVLAAVMFVCMTATAVFAAEAAKLEDGVYVLPVTMVKAGSEEESMGNNFLQPRCKVTVNGSQMTLELTMQNLDSLDVKLGDLTIKVSDGKGGYNTAVVTKTFANGYPELMTAPLPNQQEYLPIKVNMGIPAMGEQDARLKFDWSQAQKIYDLTDDDTIETSATRMNFITKASSTPLIMEPERNKEVVKDGEKYMTTEDGTDSVKVRDLPDGTYYVPVVMWNAKKDKASHGNFVKDYAKLDVKDGVKTITIYNRYTKIGLNNDSYVGDVKYVVKRSVFKETEHGPDIVPGCPSSFTFVLPNDNEYVMLYSHPVWPKLPFKRPSHPYTYGRLKIDWDGITTERPAVLDEEDNFINQTKNTLKMLETSIQAFTTD